MQPPATACTPTGSAAAPGAAAAPVAGWLRGLDVLVLGLGHSGLAMARWCAHAGARVTVWDSRESPPQAEALGRAGRLVGGALDAARAADFQLLLKSPGLAPRDAQIVPLLEAARERGTAVLGELDLFARALADRGERRAPLRQRRRRALPVGRRAGRCGRHG